MIVNVLVFLIGLLVYAGYGLPGFGYLAAATVLSYAAGLLMKRWKGVMWIAVALNAGLLLLFKVQSLTGWVLPAVFGVSYFTLQIISYLVDVYKGKYEPERNFFRYAFFVTYIPHLFVGPIERFDAMSASLNNRRMSLDGIFSGGVRALWGLFKKLVIASRAGVIIGAISADPAAYNGAFALAAMVLYSVQLYADFSGGMDMVLGLSEMLGLKLSENFDTPYLSQSFQEFWRRWHMTLGSWLREYVYIPLGGNRKGKVRKVVNLIITFLVSGIWHGVEYLLWGLINGIFVAFGTKFQTKWKNLNRAVTFLLVSLLWSFFVWPDMVTASKMVLSVFTAFNYGTFFTTVGTMGLTVGDWIVFGLATAALWAFDVWGRNLPKRLSSSPYALRTAVICALALIVLVFGMYGIGFDAQAFIYSKF